MGRSPSIYLLEALMFEREPDALPHRTAPPRTGNPRNEGESVPAQLMKLQRAAGNAGVAALLQRKASEEDEASPVKDLMRRGGGSALDEPTRTFMESRLGADFGDVRVHTGADATEAARSVQAHAYTVGSDIVFQDGQFNPSSGDGRRMLAHELTHVVQQRQGPVDGTPAPGGISISDPSDRFEQAAEASAEMVMSGGPAAVQREEAPEEEEEQLQASAVQREEAPEEEEEQLQASAVQRRSERGRA
jgi:hypothetical protein